MVPQQSFKPDCIDELLTLLADARRRVVLTYLRELPGDVATVRMLADAVDSHDDVESDTTAVALVHTHLPRLDRAGAIEFDQRSKMVRYHENPPVERLLDAVTDL